MTAKSSICAWGVLYKSGLYARILRPELALIHTPTPPQEALQRAFHAAEQAVNSWCDHVKLAA